MSISLTLQKCQVATAWFWLMTMVTDLLRKILNLNLTQVESLTHSNTKSKDKHSFYKPEPARTLLYELGLLLSAYGSPPNSIQKLIRR